MPAMRWIGMLALLALLTPAVARGVEFEIVKESPLSWARYYQMIGLGTVLMFPLPDHIEQEVAEHCAFLNRETKMTWFPLGISRERGYKLCYRVNPYTTKQVTLFCERLQMDLKLHTDKRIVCESEAGPLTPHIKGYSVD